MSVLPTLARMLAMQPTGLSFGPGTLKAQKAYEDAVRRKTEYEAEHIEHATNVSARRKDFPHQWTGENGANYTTLALLKADVELKDAFVKAVEADKAFPDSSDFYGPALKGREEYNKATEAFDRHIAKLANVYRDAIASEFDALADQAFQDADAAKVEYMAAKVAFLQAQAKLENALDRFAFAGSHGQIMGRNAIGIRGVAGPDAWESTENGKISLETAQALRFTANGSVVDVVIDPRFIVGGANK